MKKYQFLAILCFLAGLSLLVAGLYDFIKDNSDLPTGAVVGVAFCFVGFLTGLVGSLKDKS